MIAPTKFCNCKKQGGGRGGQKEIHTTKTMIRSINSFFTTSGTASHSNCCLSCMLILVTVCFHHNTYLMLLLARPYTITTVGKIQIGESSLIAEEEHIT